MMHMHGSEHIGNGYVNQRFIIVKQISRGHHKHNLLVENLERVKSVSNRQRHMHHRVASLNRLSSRLVKGITQFAAEFICMRALHADKRQRSSAHKTHFAHVMTRLQWMKGGGTQIHTRGRQHGQRVIAHFDGDIRLCSGAVVYVLKKVHIIQLFIEVLLQGLVHIGVMWRP
jgi:hypothetical protein